MIWCHFRLARQRITLDTLPQLTYLPTMSKPRKRPVKPSLTKELEDLKRRVEELEKESKRRANDPIAPYRYPPMVPPPQPWPPDNGTPWHEEPPYHPFMPRLPLHPNPWHWHDITC